MSALLRQFPDLKRIYKDYKRQGFEIIGISHITQTFQMEQARAHQNGAPILMLTWIISKTLGRNFFPTYSIPLLDGHGKNTFKNIDPVELEKLSKTGKR
jgi:hypothetical protein